MNLSENTYGDQHSPTESQAPQLDPVAELNDFFAHGQESTEFKGDKEKLVEASVVDAEQGSLNIAENIVEEKVVSSRRSRREQLRSEKKSLRSRDQVTVFIENNAQPSQQLEPRLETEEEIVDAEIIEVFSADQSLVENVEATEDLVAAPNLIEKTRRRFSQVASMPRRRSTTLATTEDSWTDAESMKPLTRRAAKREIEKAVRSSQKIKKERSAPVVTKKSSSTSLVGRVLLSATAVLSLAGIGFASAVPYFGASDAVATAGLDIPAADTRIEPLQAQSMLLSNYDTEALPADIVRDDYTAAAPPVKKIFQRWSYHFGTFVNNPDGVVQWPFASAPISSPYGPRWGGFHTGLDFALPYGTPIAAVAAGSVLAAGWNIVGGCGYGVLIDHGVLNGVQTSTLSCHMEGNSSPLAQGQVVSPGQFIGRVGATGIATGSHLHLEIWQNGNPFGRGGTWADPYVWLKNNAG